MACGGEGVVRPSVAVQRNHLPRTLFRVVTMGLRKNRHTSSQLLVLTSPRHGPTPSTRAGLGGHSSAPMPLVCHCLTATPGLPCA